MNLRFNNPPPLMSLQAQNPFGLSPDTSYVGILINSEMIDLDGDGYEVDAFKFDSTQWSDVDFDEHGDNQDGNIVRFL